MRLKACLAALAAALQAGEAQACAMVPRAGEVARIAEESALIVWDARRGIEHFIRRAVFDTKSKDFGFLVPTPSQPELGEVDDVIFQRLVEWTQPPPPRQPPQHAPAGAKSAVAVAAAPPPAVVVLQSATVAGLDAVVLKANDAAALNDWLKKHGYTSSPVLVSWLKPYIERKWIITAFKIAKKESATPRAVTTAVRMSFRTARPFYPYREPDSKAAGGAGRALEVFFVGPRRVVGTIGEKMPWPGSTLWSDDLGFFSRTVLRTSLKLPGEGFPSESVRLTRFVDLSSPRPGVDELYFSDDVPQVTVMNASAIEAENARRSRIAASLSSSGGLKEADELENQGDYRSAVRVLRRAARAGNGEAARRLGDYFDKGRPGVPRDYQESIMWYERARSLGVEPDVAGKR